MIPRHQKPSWLLITSLRAARQSTVLIVSISSGPLTNAMPRPSGQSISGRRSCNYVLTVVNGGGRSLKIAAAAAKVGLWVGKEQAGVAAG